MSSVGFRLVALPEPLALEMLAAAAPGHEYRILDMRLEANLIAVLEDFSPDVVALTALTTEVYTAQDILQAVKDFSPEIFTLVGGHHVSLMPTDFLLPQVDAIAIGEGELSFGPLLDAIADEKTLEHVPNLIWQQGDGTFAWNPRTDTVVDIDSLPSPRRDLVSQYRHEYFFLFDKPDSAITTGRGCPYRCNFCSVWEFFGGKTRQMSVRRVVEEISAVDTDHITFFDDNFLLNHKREREIAEMIRAQGVKKRYSIQCRTDSIVRHPELVTEWVDVGLYAVLLGLEGATDQSLSNVNKHNTAHINDEAIRILKDHGVIIWGCFIADPDWTEEDFRILRDYVTAKEITHTQFTVLTPLPGTELYRRKFDDLLTYDYNCFDTLHSVLPTRLDREEFYKQFANLYKQTDLGPYYDLVSEGKLTIEDCRKGKRMLDAMSQWEFYVKTDPVLGNCRTKAETHATALKAIDQQMPHPGMAAR